VERPANEGQSPKRRCNNSGPIRAMCHPSSRIPPAFLVTRSERGWPVYEASVASRIWGSTKGHRSITVTAPSAQIGLRASYQGLFPRLRPYGLTGSVSEQVHIPYKRYTRAREATSRTSGAGVNQTLEAARSGYRPRDSAQAGCVSLTKTLDAKLGCKTTPPRRFTLCDPLFGGRWRRVASLTASSIGRAPGC
jgi:hypothetical protein